MKLSLNDLARITSGDLVQKSDDTPEFEPGGVVVDSREAQRRSVFFALKGESSDGHDYIVDAASRGAATAVVNREVETDIDLIVVDDTLQALVALASWVRDVVDPITVGITGSVGKTTTKDFLASITSPLRSTVAAQRSFNTEVTVPLTLLRLRDRTEILITELGTRGPGQIAELCSFVRPQVGVVTNVDVSHMEKFHSIDAIAEEKAALIDALPEGGTAVLNADDERVSAMASQSKAEVLTFGTSANAWLRGEGISFDERGRASFRMIHDARGAWVSLSVSGHHQVINALAASAAAVALGFSLDECSAGLGKADASPWRMHVREARGVIFVNDAYNAGPKSVTSALETTSQMVEPGHRLIAVLGHMAELGPIEEAEHVRIGALVRTMADELITVGSGAKAIAEGARTAGMSDVHEVESGQQVLDLLDDLKAGDVVLVKASRVVGLERLVDEAIENRAERVG
jgi:UDP-N-acetylmuramoyl-tripeptide--D-alanyl-D-alanine ligase